jgi:hypothetical protein
LGAYLLKKNVLTMSFAPKDNHESQVQFALERGVPAYIGVLGSMKLSFPSRVFDMAHCSRCLIPWGGSSKNTFSTFHGGLYGLNKNSKPLLILFCRWHVHDGS